jgi:hypothetical protein
LVVDPDSIHTVEVAFFLLIVERLNEEEVFQPTSRL